MKKIVIFTGLLLSTAHFNVHAGQFFLAPEIGRTTLSIDREHAASTSSDSNDGSVGEFGLSAGYQFDSAFAVGFSTFVYLDASMITLGLEDIYALSSTQVWLAYEYEVSPHFRLFPAVGLNDWSLDTDRGALEKGPQGHKTYSGTDPFLRLNFEFPVTESFAPFLAYSFEPTDFGSSNTTKIGFRYSF